MIKTSLVIPVYNEIRFIERTLQSVVGEADEILVCDNASNDGTSEVCIQFSNKYSEIRYVRPVLSQRFYSNSP
jgi:glycosyltransferase involved in cell wall biosynthesis